jgi:hypothetical protein
MGNHAWLKKAPQKRSVELKGCRYEGAGDLQKIRPPLVVAAEELIAQMAVSLVLLQYSTELRGAT